MATHRFTFSASPVTSAISVNEPLSEGDGPAKNWSWPNAVNVSATPLAGAAPVPVRNPTVIPATATAVRPLPLIVTASFPVSTGVNDSASPAITPVSDAVAAGLAGRKKNDGARKSGKGRFPPNVGPHGTDASRPTNSSTTSLH